MTDKQEFEVIFRQHYGAMFRMAKRMLGDDADSKDVVSDVFVHLLNSSIDLHSESPRTFLLTSVRNRCINLLVHKQKEQAVFADLTDDTEQKTKDEQLDELHRYINEHMPALTQKIFCLRYQQGQKYREIADTLRISEVTVHRHLSQSLEQLKEHFKSLGFGIK